MITRFALALVTTLSLTSIASATESQVACDTTCPDGKVMSSFADGSDVTCLCVDSAAMDPTVADPEVPTGEDPNNTY